MAANGNYTDIWLKLQWESERLVNWLVSPSADLRELLYGAMNFAITSWTLEEWLWQAHCARRIKGEPKPERDAFEKMVATYVEMQPALRDIAGTVKHGNYRDKHWLGGAVELVCLDGPPARRFEIHYSSREEIGRLGFYVFEEVPRQWIAFVAQTGFKFDASQHAPIRVIPTDSNHVTSKA